METEITAYKKKLDQMTVLLKTYQNELETHKSRRHGFETVSCLLRETRTENLELRKQKNAMETAIKNLQNRLTSSGLSLVTRDDDEDVIVPSLSKQTLNNLVLENKRLRTLLKNQEKNSGREDIKDLSVIKV